MYYLTEQNERKDRRTALVIAISLHLALATLLYLYAADTPKHTTAKTVQSKEKINEPGPAPRTVAIP